MERFQLDKSEEELEKYSEYLVKDAKNATTTSLYDWY